MDPHQFQFPRGSFLVPVMHSRPSRTWPKLADAMDSWLDSLGFYRKHIAKDSSSLFRCIAENVYWAQVYHTKVRKECSDFASKNPGILRKFTERSVEEYTERLQNPCEPGNIADIQIASLVYKYDFVLYTDIEKPPEEITQNNYGRTIVLSLSNEDHYDTVYTKEHISNMALCQAIVYEVLYKEVFGMEGVDYAVKKMLHDKVPRCQKEMNAAFFSTGFEERLKIRDSCKNAKELIDMGIIPFPYKVAKSLDPTIYRNVEYDTWNDQKKSARHSLSWNSGELQVGSKCIVTFKDRGNITKHSAYVQEMSPNNGPVLIFDQDLGEKITVPYDTLEVIPFPVTQQTSIFQNMIDQKLKQIQKKTAEREARNERSVVLTESGTSRAERDIREEECQSSVVSSSVDDVTLGNADSNEAQDQQPPVAVMERSYFPVPISSVSTVTNSSEIVSSAVAGASPLVSVHYINTGNVMTAYRASSAVDTSIVNRTNGVRDNSPAHIGQYYTEPYRAVQSEIYLPQSSYTESETQNIGHSGGYEFTQQIPVARLIPIQGFPPGPGLPPLIPVLPPSPQVIPIFPPPAHTIPQPSPHGPLPVMTTVYPLYSIPNPPAVQPQVYYPPIECDGSCVHNQVFEPYNSESVTVDRSQNYRPEDMYIPPTAIVYGPRMGPQHITYSQI